MEDIKQNKKFMKHLYYSIGILFIIHELLWMLDIKSRLEKNRNILKEAKINKGRSFDDMTAEYINMLKTNVLVSYVILVWLFVGLFTFNWLAFLIEIIFNFVIVAPISKLIKYNNAYIILHWFNSLFGFSFGIFVILNTYHLKIDLYDWFLSLF